MLNMIRTCLFLIFLPFCFSAQAEWGENGSLAERKSHEVQRLIERKKAFDFYLKDLKTRDKERESQAFKMKKIRNDYSDLKEKQRLKFTRTNHDFPYKEYKKFISQREIIRKDNKKKRDEYSQIQKELNRIREDSKYQINGNKEYNL